MPDRPVGDELLMADPTRADRPRPLPTHSGVSTCRLDKLSLGTACMICETAAELAALSGDLPVSRGRRGLPRREVARPDEDGTSLTSIERITEWFLPVNRRLPASGRCLIRQVMKINSSRGGAGRSWLHKWNHRDDRNQTLAAYHLASESFFSSEGS